MRKKITLFCGMIKFEFMIEEEKIQEIIKVIFSSKLKVGETTFGDSINMQDYMPDEIKQMGEPLYIRKGSVTAIGITSKSNIQIPTKIIDPKLIPRA